MVLGKKARVSGKGEMGASSNRMEKIKYLSQHPMAKNRFEAPDQFALFRLSFKVSEDYRCKNLFCIITINDGSVSEDIYRGYLHKFEEAHSSRIEPHDLLLTGPNKFIEAFDPFFIMLVIYDDDDPKSSIPLANANSSRGTLPLQPANPDLFLWGWDDKGRDFRFNEVQTVDLIQDRDAGALPLDFFTFGSCGSLLLRYAVFQNSVVAKVEVKVKARRHHICGGIVTAKFDHCKEEIVLFRRQASDCSCRGTTTSEEKSAEQLLPLDLSRSSVTMPSTASALIVRAVLLDSDNNVIVNGSAQLSVPDSFLLGPFWTSENVISGRTRAQSVVTVTWTGPVVGEAPW